MASEGLKIKQPSSRMKNTRNFSFVDLLNKDLFPRKLSDKQKEVFFLELSSMLEAGIDIKAAFDIIIKQQKKENEIQLYEKLKKTLIEGKSLFECLKESKQFTPYEYYCVQIGEETGRLYYVLNQLADYLTNKIKTNKQIMKSLSYPIAITATAIVAVIFMISFVVPMFADVFKRFGSDLPALTKLFINLSNGVKENIAIILIILLLVIIPTIMFWKKPGVKQKRQELSQKIPIINNMLASIYLSRMCTSFALLTQAKVPLINSLKLVAEMVDYYPIQSALLKIENDIMNGETLYHSMQKFKIFDTKMTTFLKIGEETNKLGFFFEKLHQRFSDEVDSRANTLNTFLEPIIISFLGIMIGLILVAMYLPMFKLSTSFG